jgi:DNA-binding transcriptional MerR regulator
MRIGEAARRAGVNIQTLRYYERRGLLAEPVRTSSGYRSYSAHAVRVVRFVKRAQELGFTLAEVAELLRLRDRRAASRDRVRRRAEAKLRDIDGRLRALRAMRGALRALLDSCRCGTTPECPILEALEEPGESDVAVGGLPGGREPA